MMDGSGDSLSDGTPSPMGVAPLTPGSDPLEWNLLHPYVLYRGYNSNKIPYLLHAALDSPGLKSFIPSLEASKMLCVTSNVDPRGDVRGLTAILLEVARGLGGGEITMESAAQAKDSPLFLATAQHLYDSPDTYKDGINSMLGDFFSVVEKYRSLKGPWWTESSEVAAHYHARWSAVVADALRVGYKNQLPPMLASARDELERRGLSYSPGPYLLTRDELDMVAPIIARDPLRGVTLRQIIELIYMAREYNLEWALASFQWGVEEKH